MPDERFADHLRHPRRRGHEPAGGHDGVAGGAACGDLVRFSVAVEGDRVADAGFEAAGCGATIAAASAAVELVRGTPLLDAARVGSAAVAAELGGLSAGKLHAADLAADALARAIGAAARADGAVPAAPGRTLVAMSGGVDSAVAALLADGEVVAVTLELWRDPENDGERSCCSADAVRGARALAHRLGLPHLTIDLRDEFRAGVVQPWLDEHAAGLTPNPCVRCNGEVRLDAMLALADRVGAATLTTGHYARRSPDGLLRLAADPAKDQAYMLAGLGRASLARLRFPLGELTKPEVREIAREHGLPVAGKPDSQDLCFLAGTGRRRFLERHGRLREPPRGRRGPRRAPPGRPRRRAPLHGRPAPRHRRGRGGRPALRARNRRARQHGDRRTARGTGDRRRARARPAPASRAGGRRRGPAALPRPRDALRAGRRRAAPGAPGEPPGARSDRRAAGRRRRRGMRHNRGVSGFTTSDEIRERFLSFFEARDHRRLPSGSLVPATFDPSVLLTTAGMHPLKPYFLGLEQPPHRRLTTCQKCFRSTDIENVGTTTRHLTFFEMLGNFSIGDYFKQGAVELAWELSLEGFGFRPEDIWISVFEGDDELGLGPDEEAIAAWESVGVPRERIVLLPREENFWQAGPTGPCGPCSELYLDRGLEWGEARRPARRRERALPGVLEPRVHAVRPGPDQRADAAAQQEHRHGPGPQPHGA